jgi:hypothetical protein
MARLPHISVTEKRVVDLVAEYHMTASNPGICLVCGEEQDGCEPDAEGYTCEHCGEPTVMGVEEILLAGMYHP